MRPITNSASITTPRFVSAVGGRAVRAGLYTARAGNAGRLTTNNADLLGRLLLVVGEVHRTVRGAVRRIGHIYLFCGLDFTAFKLRLGGAARGRTASSRSSHWNEPLSTVAPAVGPQRSSNVANTDKWSKLSCSKVRVQNFVLDPSRPSTSRRCLSEPLLGLVPRLVPLSHTHKMAGASAWPLPL